MDEEAKSAVLCVAGYQLLPVDRRLYYCLRCNFLTAAEDPGVLGVVVWKGYYRFY